MNDDEKEILQHFDSIFNTNTIKYVKLNMPLLKFLFDKFEEDLFTPSPKYEKLRIKQIEISDRLHTSFNEKQEELFREYWQVTNQMGSIEDEQLFYFGYVMANELTREGKIKE